MMCVVYFKGRVSSNFHTHVLVGVASKMEGLSRKGSLAKRTEWGALFKVKEVLAAESFSRWSVKLFHSSLSLGFVLKFSLNAV